MKIFGIVVSLAFLGASYSVSGNPLDPNQIGGTLKDGICSAVRSIKSCPVHMRPLRLRKLGIVSIGTGISSVGYRLPYFLSNLGAIIKQPCAAPNQPDKCKDFKNNEKQCLNGGCTWLHGTSALCEY